jgi:hypothetical protein
MRLLLMRPLLMLAALFLMGATAVRHVDPDLVGVWTLNVPNSQGTDRWVWDVHGDGTYSFHAEGPGNVPAHSGIFAGFAGHYSLNSTTMQWTDVGTYQLQGDSLLASGKLGSGTWTRMQDNDVAPPMDPASWRAGLAQIPSGARVAAGTPLFNSAICNRLLATSLPTDELPEGLTVPAPTQLTADDANLACVVLFPIFGPDDRQRFLEFFVYKNSSDADLAFLRDPTSDKLTKGAEFKPTLSAKCNSLRSESSSVVVCRDEGASPYNGLGGHSPAVVIVVTSVAFQSELIPNFGVPAQILTAAKNYFKNQVVDLAFADSQFLAARK